MAIPGIDFLFDTASYPARWHCGHWTSIIGWTYILSDLAIFLAYTGIPVSLLYYRSKLKATGLQINYIFYLFAGFIFFCGATHLIDAIVFWKPIYNFAALILLCTALISVATLFVIITLLPATLKFIMQQFEAKAVKLELETLKALEAQRALAKLTELDQLKSDFLANVSHELRTPLTLIIGPLESILQHSADISPENKENLLRMHRNSQKLYALVNDVLDFSKLEAGKFEVHEEVVNFNETLDFLIDDVKGLADARKVTLSYSRNFDVEFMLLDIKLFEKIMMNLLSNALKFTPENGQITVELKKEGDNAQITVKDTGIGIPPSQINHLFERFHQIDSSRTRVYEGTGIGLAIANQFAILLQGKIAVESELKKGTTFTLTLPIRSISTESAPVVTKASRKKVTLEHTLGLSEKSTATPISKLEGKMPLILIADDNVEMRSYIISLLKNDYEIIPAGDGEEALELISKYHPQVILSDVMMPKMDGFQLTTTLKSIPEYKHIPIILITAKAGKEAIICGLDVGADDYLTKPFSPEELRARTQSAFRSYHRWQELNDAKQKVTESYSALEKIHEQLKVTQSQLIQNSKMAALGQLAAGVAHEINNPISFVISNIDIMGNYIKNIKEAFELVESSRKNSNVNVGQLWDSFCEQKNLHSSMQTTSELISESLEGLDRIVEIVSSLKTFSYSYEGDLEETDINECIDAMLKMMRNEIKYNAVTKNFGALPTFLSHPRQLSQVFLNILMNANHAIKDKGEITITTECIKDEIIIKISDTGVGIKPEDVENLFNPFFTTKPIGEGTGLGLSISYNLVKKHGGNIEVESDIGKGSTFIIHLPINNNALQNYEQQNLA